jgi:hypothetical protein
VHHFICNFISEITVAQKGCETQKRVEIPKVFLEMRERMSGQKCGIKGKRNKK